MMRLFSMVAALVLTGLAATASPAAAEPQACPDLAQAKQVGACPSEEEIQHLYKRNCGTQAARDAADPGECESPEAFRARNATAMWESSCGEFMGYASCLRRADEVKTAALTGMGISERGGVTKVTCIYDGGVTLSLRTRETCRSVEGKGSTDPVTDCSDNPAACGFTCE